jgi:hypothetical protein
MRLSAESKVRKTLQDMLDVELSAVLRSETRAGARLPSLKTIHAMSKEIAERMVENPTFLKAVGEIAIKQDKQWLTTEDAAKMSGFSRPFIIALLDGPTYSGTVNRTEKGHRRVLATEFKQWLIRFGTIDRSELPKTVADVRTGVVMEPEGEPPSVQERKARASSRKRALAAARELGLA